MPTHKLQTKPKDFSMVGPDNHVFVIKDLPVRNEVNPITIDAQPNLDALEPKNVSNIKSRHGHSGHRFGSGSGFEDFEYFRFNENGTDRIF